MAGFETLEAAITSTSAPCKEDNRPLDACYTSEQRDVILQLLNTASPSELAGVKLLRGRKSLNIVDYRTKNGPFKTLESVVNVPLLKHKSAVTVFNSILNPVKKGRKVRIQLAKFIRPEVDKSWLEVSLWILCVFISQTYLIFTYPPVQSQSFIHGIKWGCGAETLVPVHHALSMTGIPDQLHFAALVCYI